jgi:hypothetical protein
MGSIIGALVGAGVLITICALGKTIFGASTKTA